MRVSRLFRDEFQYRHADEEIQTTDLPPFPGEVVASFSRPVAEINRPPAPGCPVASFSVQSGQLLIRHNDCGKRS
jgi:hypothetical protein